MQLSDILYVLFRHKWKITIISAVAIIAAAGIYSFFPAPMQSNAKLFIKYVMDNREPTVLGDPNGKTRMPDQRGESVVATEMEILTSYDLARDAARSLTDKQLLSLCGSTNLDRAAGAIRRGLLPQAAKGSSVVQLGFSHRDPELVMPVLRQVITNYFVRHQEVHRPQADFDEKLETEKKNMELELQKTEKLLSDAKSKANVIGLDDSKTDLAAKIARLQEQLYMAAADLQERQAKGKRLKEYLAGSSAANTNSASTNTSESLLDTPKPVPPNVLSEYKRLNSAVENLLVKDDQLALEWTTEYYLRKKLKEQLEVKEEQKKKLEATYPSLVMTPSLSERRTGSGAANPLNQSDPVSDEMAIAGLQARGQVLSLQLSNVLSEAGLLREAELKITDLQRKKDLQESAYRNIAASLEQAGVSKRLEPGRVVNITQIQEPTPPGQDREKIQKIAGMVLLGGLGLAFGLAFLLELYVDRSLKNPREVEAKTGLPVFISIPWLGANGAGRALNGNGATALLAEKNGAGANGAEGDGSNLPSVVVQSAELAPWDSRHVFRPFYESLRDRLINFFEMKNLTHKPKLVAVSSVSEGAGVSTIAAGLAAALSETGEGNVLLVDMNVQNGAAHHFYKGDLACGIDEALTADKRDDARVQENLYVVSERDSIERLPGILPKRFKNLVPKLKASDYDYIIFDMPPVTQISITPRLARFMDMVFLVAESGKSDRDAVKRAGALLAESKTNVGVVLNKRREYLPKSLQETV